MSKGINEIASGANDVARNIAESAVGVREIANKQEEAFVLIKEAIRYIDRASKAASRSHEGDK